MKVGDRSPARQNTVKTVYLGNRRPGNRLVPTTARPRHRKDLTVPDPTPVANLRVPRDMWAAYKRVCERLGRDRTDDLLSHIRRQITEHGDDTDRAALEAAEAELAERRARKGGRPRKNP